MKINASPIPLYADETKQIASCQEKQQSLSLCFLVSSMYWLGTRHKNAQQLMYSVLGCLMYISISVWHEI